jgi:dTDP-4-dehydrorhamnose reductase
MRVLLTGASGQLGAYLLERLAASGHEVVAWSGMEAGRRAGRTLRPVDLADPVATAAALDEADPDAVLHAGAISSNEAARRSPDLARAVNVEGTGRLADWCRNLGRRLVFTSTDLVFDGRRGWYREDDPAEPALTYGRTKRLAEPAVLTAPRGLVARLSLLFGPTRAGCPAYFDRTLDALRRGEPQAFFADEYRTPLDFRTAADALVRLLEGEAVGTVHVGGPERLSRHELVRRVADALGLDPGLVRPNRRADVPAPEPRPADVSLDTARLAHLLPDLPRPTVEAAILAMTSTDAASPR